MMKTQEKLLTISIAAYNAEHTLGRALTSLECADDLFGLLDIIIVDDGSTDGTSGVAGMFISKHPGEARLVRKTNGGYGSTINESLKLARGRYFRLLDADDAFDTAGLEELLRTIKTFSEADPKEVPKEVPKVVPPKVVQKVVPPKELPEEGKAGPDMIISPFYYSRRIYSDGRNQYATQLSDRHDRMQEHPVRIEDARLDDGLMMFEICVRTDVLRKSEVRFTENCYYTDNEFVMAAELYAASAVKSPEPVYIYSIGVEGQSMSVCGRRLHYEDKIRAAKGVFKIYSNYGGYRKLDIYNKEDLNRNYDLKCKNDLHSKNSEGSAVSAAGEEMAGAAARADAGITGTRKLITDILLSTMVREVCVSLMIQDDPAAYRGIFTEFDRELKEKWPYAYEASKRSRLVSAVRKSGTMSYGLMCKRILKSEEKRVGYVESTGCTNRMDHIDRGDCMDRIDLRAMAVGLGCTDTDKGCGAENSCNADESCSGYENCVADDRTLMIAEYIMAACMVIQCRTVYMHIVDCGMIVNRASWAIMMAAMAVILTKSRSLRRASCIRDAALICASMAVYAGVFIAVNPVNYLRVIRCASSVTMVMILIRSPRGRQQGIRIMGCFRDLMVIIAVISMICWVFGSVLNLLPCTDLIYIDWSATGKPVRIPTFLYMYFETQWTDWSLVDARNTGIFVEGPMAGFAWSLALVTECFITRCRDRRNHIASVVILTISVLSTLSLICYGSLILTAVFSIIMKIKASDGDRKKMATGLAASSAAAVMILCMLAVNKMQNVTGLVRANDFAVGFRAWLAHPVFGGGFESLEYLQQFMPEWRSFDTGFSNSPMEILAQGGIYLAIPYVYAFTSAFVRARRRKDIRLTAVTVSFAYLFTFLVVPYQYITFFVIILLALDVIRDESAETDVSLLISQ